MEIKHYKERIINVISMTENTDLKMEHFTGICENSIKELKPINSSMCFSVDDKLIVLIYNNLRSCPVHDAQLLISMKNEKINNALVFNIDNRINCREIRL